MWHDRTVALTLKELTNTANFTLIHDIGSVKTDWFYLTDNQPVSLEAVTNLILINELNKSVIVLETGCSCNAYMDTCFASNC